MSFVDPEVISHHFRVSLQGAFQVEAFGHMQRIVRTKACSPWPEWIGWYPIDAIDILLVLNTDIDWYPIPISYWYPIGYWIFDHFLYSVDIPYWIGDTIISMVFTRYTQKKLYEHGLYIEMGCWLWPPWLRWLLLGDDIITLGCNGVEWTS